MADEGHPRHPPAPKAKPNCLRAAGISCLAAAIVGVAIGLWIVNLISRNPALKKAYTEAQAVAQCQMNLQNPRSEQDVSGALERYARRNSKYPTSLEELYPDFLEERAVLHCPADPRPESTVSYEYTPPSADDSPSAIVIECDRHVVVKGQPPWTLQLRRDGRIVRHQPVPRTSPVEPK